MAVIKLSAFVTRISGKVGGSVFQMTSSGQIVKNNSYSLPQNSPRQSIAQTKIQTVSSRWLLLTPAEKNAWAAETINYPYQNKVGDESIYNGYQLFLKLNNNLLVAQLPINIEVPTFEAVALMPSFSFEIGTGYLIVGLTDAVVGQTIVFYISKAVTENESGSNLVYVEFAQKLISDPDEMFNLWEEFNNNFGNPISGAFYYMRYKIIATNSGNSTNFSPNYRAGVL